MRPHWWLVSFAVWTAICVLSVTQHDLSAVQQGRPSAWLETFVNWLPGFHVRALLSPLVLWLSVRSPRRWLLHAGLSALFALAYAALHALVIGLFWPHESQWDLFQKILTKRAGKAAKARQCAGIQVLLCP